MSLRAAKRRKTALILAFAGYSGSGKTYSSLMAAAGLAGPKGRVALLDTENGRGTYYADDKHILAAMPRGEYEYDELQSPFSPQRYLAKIEEIEKAGVDALVIDSFSHEWEGSGGCNEIAEDNKNKKGQWDWILAKRLHKTLVNRVTQGSMHIIFSLRAREKVEVITEQGGKTRFESQGIQPITEKNFVYEMLMSGLIDVDDHKARPLKVLPRYLSHLLPREGVLIDKAFGERLREWMLTGVAETGDTQILIERSREHARLGVRSYKDFFETLTAPEKKSLLPYHDDNKRVAAEVDDARDQRRDDEGPSGSFSEEEDFTDDVNRMAAQDAELFK